MTGRRRFRGKTVYSGGIVSQRAVFREKVDTGDPNTAPAGGGGGAAGLQWDPDAQNVARANTRVWLSNGHSVSWKAFGKGANVYLGNAIGAESITYSATGLPSGLSLDSTTGELTGIANPVGYSNVTVTASDGSNEITKTIYVLQRSQQEYTTVGTFSLTLPNYVDKIHAVCVGGGGGGSFGPGSPNRFAEGGGAGGGLRWIQDLPVSNNEELTIVVGAGGQTEQGSPTTSYAGLPGGPSKIVRASGTPGETTLLEAEGGGGGEGQVSPAPESLVYGGRGTPFGIKPALGGALVGGGNGGDNRWNLSTTRGGGSGAGGYMGDGGRGSNGSPFSTYPPNSPPIAGVNQINQRSEHGRGGAGAGGGKGSPTPLNGGGGGVGIWGMHGDGAMSPNSLTYFPPNAYGLAVPGPVAAADSWIDNLEKEQDRSQVGWNSAGGVVPAKYPGLPAPGKGGFIHGWSGSYGYHSKFRGAPVWGPSTGTGPSNWLYPTANPSYVSQGVEGGLFGGGGSGFQPASTTYMNHQGGRGAVRVIWGEDREWPNKNTGDQ